MKKKATDYLYHYYDDQIKEINVPETDYKELPSFNNKSSNRGLIPKIVYACLVLIFTAALVVNWGKQTLLEKHINTLDSQYNISKLIPKGLRDINIIMYEYFQKGEKL